MYCLGLTRPCRRRPLLLLMVLLNLVAVRVLRAEPVKTHPRLLLRTTDLAELRRRMTPSNPVWVAFESQVQVALEDWRSHKVPQLDGGTHTGNSNYKSEQYAMLFAFVSLLETDPQRRQLYVTAARECLMNVIDRAVLGPATPDADGRYPPFRHPDFILADRGFAAEAFPLAVDWLQAHPGALSAVDLGKIRKTFLWWGRKANEAVYFSPWNPQGLVNDPALLRLTPPAPQDVVDQRQAVREALNNHYATRLKMMIFMPMALDPTDDVPRAAGDDAPPGALTGYTVGATPDEWIYKNTGYLRLGTGGWLYQTDYALRHDGAGGGSQEGLEYMTNGLGPVALSLLALYTAGQDDASRWGSQVVLEGNPFWDKSVDAFLSHLPPAPRLVDGEEWRGPQFELAWFGDGEVYGQNDQFIKVLGPLALYDYYRHGTTAPRLQAVRYIQTHLAPGGASVLAERIRASYSQQRLIDAITYFLLFDPTAPAAVLDPRANQPTNVFASFDDNATMGAIFARHGEGINATYFDYRLGWNRIDHQHGDGNSFELWRNGVWLTKRWIGYGAIAQRSDYNNAMSIQNNPLPVSDTLPHHTTSNRHGGQYAYAPAGDPRLLAQSLAANFIYVSGEAAPLYNLYDKRQKVDDVVHATRDVVWLKPDFLVIYDRATTRSAGHFKRFTLAMPAVPRILAETTHQTVYDTHSVAGVSTHAPRAELYTTTLLPARPNLSIERKRQMTGTCTVASGERVDCDSDAARHCVDVDAATGVCACAAPSCPSCTCRDETAVNEPMNALLVVGAPDDPSDARFLHVVQGSDFGTALVPPSLIESSGETPYEGAVVDKTAVLFKVRSEAPFGALTYRVPATTATHLITGLAPNVTYHVSQQTNDETLTLQIDTNSGGAPVVSDSGGVLIVGSGDRQWRGHPSVDADAVERPPASRTATGAAATRRKR